MLRIMQSVDLFLVLVFIKELFSQGGEGKEENVQCFKSGTGRKSSPNLEIPKRVNPGDHLDTRIQKRVNYNNKYRDCNYKITLLRLNLEFPEELFYWKYEKEVITKEYPTKYFQRKEGLDSNGMKCVTFYDYCQNQSFFRFQDSGGFHSPDFCKKMEAFLRVSVPLSELFVENCSKNAFPNEQSQVLQPEKKKISEEVPKVQCWKGKSFRSLSVEEPFPCQLLLDDSQEDSWASHSRIDKRKWTKFEDKTAISDQETRISIKECEYQIGKSSRPKNSVSFWEVEIAYYERRKEGVPNHDAFQKEAVSDKRFLHVLPIKDFPEDSQDSCYVKALSPLAIAEFFHSHYKFHLPCPQCHVETKPRFKDVALLVLVEKMIKDFYQSKNAPAMIRRYDVVIRPPGFKSSLSADLVKPFLNGPRASGPFTPETPDEFSGASKSGFALQSTRKVARNVKSSGQAEQPVPGPP